VKNQQQTISIEKKLDVKSRPEKCEWTVDTCCSVRVTHSSVRTIFDNAERITECGKSGSKVFV
jgi:IS30 family transposase